MATAERADRGAQPRRLVKKTNGAGALPQERKVAAYFETREVAKLSGVTETMIDYLCRHGLLKPSVSLKRQVQGYGQRRQFSFQDVRWPDRFTNC